MAQPEFFLDRPTEQISYQFYLIKRQRSISPKYNFIYKTYPLKT